MANADKRREAFIADIVGVCKKHRVMVKVDDLIDFDTTEFEEHPENDGYSFCFGVSEIEESVRLAVWDVIHPSC